MLKFNFQEHALDELQSAAISDIHSLLIEGSEGSGKTYLANEYGRMLSVQNVISIDPTVKDIREAIDKSFQTSDRIVLIFENLDTATNRSAYTLLKFLEEPRSNIYIVITCRNIKQVPSTILSRSQVITVGHPNYTELCEYSKYIDRYKFDILSHRDIWKVIKSFKDVDFIYQLPVDKISYLEDKVTNLQFKDTISTMIWELSHYPDNTDIDLSFMIRYILCSCKNSDIQYNCISALYSIQQSRISQFAILSKFLFECKYGEVRR